MRRSKKRKRGYPRLYQRPNGYWYAEYARNRARSLKTKVEKEAIDKLAIEKQLRKNAKFRKLDEVKRIRLGEFIKKYLAHREKEVSLGKIQAGTLRNDKLALGSLLDVLGDVPLRMINRDSRDDYKRKLLAGAKDKLKRMGGINAYIRHLRTAFNWALLDDPEYAKPAYIVSNPFASQRKGDSAEFDTGERLPRFLESTEIDAVKRTIEKRIKKLYEEFSSVKTPKWRRGQLKRMMERQREIGHMAEFYLQSGMRRTELVELTWPCIKLDIEMIHLKKTKRKKERYIPIPPRLKQLIVEEMGVKDLGAVFPRWRHPDSVSRMFTKLFKEAGLDDKTLHCTRHSYGSWAVMSGMDLRTIKENMGHQDIATTMIYARVSDEHRKREAAKLRFGTADEAKT